MNGQLLIKRDRITLAVGANTIDTGIKASDLGDPTIAERLMVVPLAASTSAPGAWTNVTVTANPTIVDGTVRVAMANGGGAPVVLNVCFWAPHSSIGPIDASDNYIA